MITGEKDIINRCGKQNPFSVPEGYFDNLTARVMANIPAEETKVISITPAKKFSWKGWTSLAAACIVGTVVCVNVYNNKTSSIDSSKLMSNVTASANEESYDEAYRQEVLNYAMVDYNDVYNYMTGNSY